MASDRPKHVVSSLYCCTVHLVDSLIITQPTHALIVCNLFLNQGGKWTASPLASLHEKQRTQMQDMLQQQH